MDNERITLDVLFGSVSLSPHLWVIDDRGRMGRQYLRVDYDKDGNEKSRKILEPVAWLSFD